MAPSSDRISRIVWVFWAQGFCPSTRMILPPCPCDGRDKFDVAAPISDNIAIIPVRKNSDTVLAAPWGAICTVQLPNQSSIQCGWPCQNMGHVSDRCRYLNRCSDTEKSLSLGAKNPHQRVQAPRRLWLVWKNDIEPRDQKSLNVCPAVRLHFQIRFWIFLGSNAQIQTSRKTIRVPSFAEYIHVSFYGVAKHVRHVGFMFRY